MRAVLARRAGDENLPVMAVIGSGPDQDRSIAALNIALAAARDGAKVLLIDADLKERALSNKVSHFANSEPSRFGWLNIGAKAARAIRPPTEFRSCRPSMPPTRKPVTPSERRLRRPVPPAAMTS